MATATATRRKPQPPPHPPSGMHPPSSFEVDQADGASGAASPLLARPGARNGCGASAAALLESYSHPLVVPSDRAFTALLVVPLVVWWVAVLSGVWVYEGLPKGQRVYHLMMWFDKGVLRPAGALVPFGVLALRALVHAGSHAWRRKRQQRGRQGKGQGQGQQQQQQQQQPQSWLAGLQLGSLLLNCLTVYAAMAAARLAIYLTHYFLLSRRYLEFHLVSDHIFLAATMLICLHSEVVCLMSDMVRAEQRLQADQQEAELAGQGQQQGPQEEQVSVAGVALTLLFVVALFLYLFTAADMYYTAKYYHFPLESLCTTFLVFLLFQAPMLAWLVQRRRRSLLSRHTA